MSRIEPLKPGGKEKHGNFFVEHYATVSLWYKTLVLVFLLSATAQEYAFTQTSQRYKIGLIDLMLLKRQKLGALTLAKELGADGIEVDMGGLGTRPSFDNQLLNDSIRQLFLDKAKELNIEIFSLAMTGYYAQSFCGRTEYIQSIEDCIATMKAMHVKIAFLPLGVQCDLAKNPGVRDSVVARLKVAGKMAETAGVVIAIETALSAAEEVRLLNEIKSPGIKIYFNFSLLKRRAQFNQRTANTGERPHRYDTCQQQRQCMAAERSPNQYATGKTNAPPDEMEWLAGH